MIERGYKFVIEGGKLLNMPNEQKIFSTFFQHQNARCVVMLVLVNGRPDMFGIQ